MCWTERGGHGSGLLSRECWPMERRVVPEDGRDDRVQYWGTTKKSFPYIFCLVGWFLIVTISLS